MYVLSVPPQVRKNISKVYCKNCNSILAYNPSDVITDYDYTDFTGIMKAILGEEQMTSKRVVKCPVCGEYVELCEEKNNL